MVAVRPEQEPRPRRSGGQDGGLVSNVSAQAWSVPPARVLAFPIRPTPSASKRAGKVPGPPRPLSGPAARLRLSTREVAGRPGLPLQLACPRRRQKWPRLPENASPAAVSKSPTKVARQVPSPVMLQSACRAAPRRRWVGARGRRADGSPGFKAARREGETARNGASTPKCEQLRKSELQRLRGRGERVVGRLPGR